MKTSPSTADTNPASPVNALSVSELNREVKRLLELSYNKIWIKGELSSLSRPASGHWYFTLKDAHAQIRCAMFKGFNQRLRFQPKEGDELLLLAKVSLYEGRGDYQLIVEAIEPAGLGQLQAAFEQLKAKLSQEGLFDVQRKQAIPERPQRAYVITSPTGAAIHDIISVAARRYPALELLLIPVQVQGQQAAPDIVRAIGLANQHAEASVIVLGRGGGSLEDLWAFNEESVARAISQSKLPVISAVGHEVDFTIADFVADLRTATPSAAAETISPDQFELMQLLDLSNQRLGHAMRAKVERCQYLLTQTHLRLQHPGDTLKLKLGRLQELDHSLKHSASQLIKLQQSRLATLQAKLAAHAPQQQVDRHAWKLSHLTDRLHQAMMQVLSQGQNRFELAARGMHLASPLATLGRGYAIVGSDAHPVLRHYQEVQPGERVKAVLSEGTLECIVEQTHAEHLIHKKPKKTDEEAL